MKLEKNNGEYLLYEGKLPPHGTDYASIAKFFPTIHEFLGENSVAMAIVESEADLAVMHLSHHQISGVYSAEHFMHGSNYMDGKYYLPSGA